MVQRAEGQPGGDFNDPVEIDHRIWWVGHKLENDPFQCHAYLIEQGENSLLIDPGSLLTFDSTLKKIEKILPFRNIKYFICHHQDPDIAASLPRIDSMIERPDAVVVTHWRAQALLKHYNLKSLKFWLVDANDWKLELEDRNLRFIFTPYAHFPGAFVSFDSSTGLLFSSDLFGGFTEEFHLFAQDESYFEQLRPFHEHYIPSRDILEFAITGIQKYPVKTIAPQHGSIITEDLVPFILEKLRHLECGIYLFARQNSDLQKLSRLNQTLRELTRIMLLYRDFRDIAGNLLEIVKRELPVHSMEFFATLESVDIIHLATETNYTPMLLNHREELPLPLGWSREQWRDEMRKEKKSDVVFCTESCCLYSNPDGSGRLMIPLFSLDEGVAGSIAILHLTSIISESEGIEQMIDQIAMPLQVALERETIYQIIDRERKRSYERSIRDPLTGCFTRLYMLDVMTRHCEIHDRHPDSPLSAVMIDIDHFKSVNDRFGHRAGDEVLRLVASKLLSGIRSADILVRYGGEEFLIFLIGESDEDALQFAERIRREIASTEIRIDETTSIRITMSAGIATRQRFETLDDFIQRADRALYRSKHEGRDRVSVDG